MLTLGEPYQPYKQRDKLSENVSSNLQSETGGGGRVVLFNI